ncbi:MAG: ABC transporter ATP-binding protein [Gemmatimonadaceae bacterium]|nr:ABC transporter ATP-binding protein [Gemmatimonadaceae bacterium]
MSDVAGAPMVQFDHVTLAFGGVTALSDVSFHVLPRELFAIIGPNGAGKTSIFNCLSGVYRPTKGEIRFQGERIDRRSPVTIARRGIARTFQNLALFHDLTVLDNVMLGRHHLMRTDYLSAALWLGRAKHEEMTHRARCEDILEIMELESYRFSHVASLPYGVRKRVEVARALAMEPTLLLLDEPVAGMNQEESEDMARYTLEIRNELGIAIILVEHDMRLVMDLADRVLALDFGKVLSVGTPDAVRSDDAVIQAYLGATA